MTEKIYPSLKSRLATRLMTYFFKLLYHTFAPAYDLVAGFVSLGQWRNWVKTSTDLLQGPRVLELGFGPGHLQTHLNELGVQVFGLDESMQMCRQAQSRLHRKGTRSRLSRGVGQYLPFCSNSFESVVATFPPQYILQPVTLQEINRVLKPGGKLVILFAAWLTGQSAPEKALALLFKVTGQVPEDQAQATSTGYAALTPLFKQAGLQADVQFREYRRSRLLYILAQKDNGQS